MRSNMQKTFTRELDASFPRQVDNLLQLVVYWTRRIDANLQILGACHWTASSANVRGEHIHSNRDGSIIWILDYMARTFIVCIRQTEVMVDIDPCHLLASWFTRTPITSWKITLSSVRGWVNHGLSTHLSSSLHSVKWSPYSGERAAMWLAFSRRSSLITVYESVRCIWN